MPTASSEPSSATKSAAWTPYGADNVTLDELDVVSARRGAAVLGSPIAHSLSPALHRAAYDALGLDGWTYRAVDCTETELGETLRSLEADGLAGASMTMPLKRAVMPMLARTDRVAADVGGANTVLFGGLDGDWYGANTDVPGMVSVLQPAAPQSLTVLGAGATAASALAAAADLGVASVVVVARRPDAAADLYDVGARVLVSVEVRPWSSYGDALEADAVISTVPAGAADALADVMPRSPRLLFDVVYAPWPTPLATAWRNAGGAVVGGLELLVAQAAEQIRLMTGLQPPVDAMRAAGEAALSSR